jgi:hypothetical protein
MRTNHRLPLKNRLSFKVAYQLLAVALLTLGLNAYLNYSNFDKVQRQLAESRVLVSSGDVKRAITGAMDLGLSLDEISNLRQIIQAGLETSKYSDVLEFSVLGLNGSVIASTAPEPGGWENVARWPVEKLQKESFRSLASDRFAIGLPLVNAFSVQTGWLVVAYNGQAQLIAREKMQVAVLKDFGLAALLASVVIFLGVQFLTRGFSRELNAVIDAQASSGSNCPAADEQTSISNDELDELMKACSRFQKTCEVLDAFKGNAEPTEKAGRAS